MSRILGRESRRPSVLGLNEKETAKGRRIKQRRKRKEISPSELNPTFHHYSRAIHETTRALLV